MGIDPVELLIEHGLLITVDAERRIITDGAIAIRGDRILEVGKTDELRNLFRPLRVIDASDRVVTPGFVNAHTHLTEPGRGFIPDNIPPLPWIVEWTAPLMATLTPEEEYLLSKLVLLEAVKTGTTTFVEGGTIKYPDEALQAVKEVGIRVNLGRWTWDLPQEPAIFRQTTEQALIALEDFFRRYHGAADGLVSVWMHLIGAGSCSDELIQGAKELADRLGVGISQHQSYTRADVEQFMAEHAGHRPMEHFADLGVLDRNVRFCHMNALSNHEVGLIREFQVKPVHVILAAMKAGYGATVTGKHPEMLAVGVPVSLGSDGSNASNSFDMVRAMYCVAGIYKDSRLDNEMIPAEQAIEMATINGAKSVLMEDEVGSLEKGKLADIVLFDRKRPEWLPMINPVNNLVYSADGRSVHTVLVGGRIVAEGFRSTLLDEDQLYAQIEAIDWAQRFNERTGLPLKMRWPVC
jgi:cytosine/adenosine deaminase-related metal-dependent hydrolase